MKNGRLLAVWCARRFADKMKHPRSVELIDVAEAYAHGNATAEELSRAHKEAVELAFDACGFRLYPEKTYTDILASICTMANGASCVLDAIDFAVSFGCPIDEITQAQMQITEKNK